MTLKYIIHLSDTHIKKGDAKQSRFEEYSTVFDNLYQSIKDQTHNLNPDDFIIVITGDIFDNKDTVGAYGLALYKKLIQLLTSLSRVIMILGNHDRHQNDPNQPSLIESALNIPNLTILTDTQTFIIDDIGFSYLSVNNTLDHHTTCGRVQSLPEFPKLSNVKHKIALFHGSFVHAKLNNDTEVREGNSTYPFEMLTPFDFALLGDIHLRHKGTCDNCIWAYAGSLLQCNHGEDIIDHGYLIWDLDNKHIKEVNVYNPFGKITLKEHDNTILLKIRSNYEPLTNYITSEFFPKHVEIRLKSDIDLVKLFTFLNAHNITYDIINRSLDTITIDPQTTHKPDIEIDRDSLLQYFNEYLTPPQQQILSNIVKSYENILFDYTKFPESMQQLCLNYNKDLTKIINTDLQSDAIITHPFTVKYLEWTNMFCFEGRNYINFEETESTSFLITAPNGQGKSSIYDIQTQALWGSMSKSKQPTEAELTAGIINYKSDTAETIIDFSVQNKTYRMIRKYNKKALGDKNILNKSHTTLYEYISPNEIMLINKDSNACNEKIKSLCGTLEDFLSASMVTQNADCDVLKMDYKTTTAIVDKAFNLDKIKNLSDLFQASNKKYKDIKKLLESKIEVYAKEITSSVVDTSLISNLQQELSKLQQERDDLQKEHDSILIDISSQHTKQILSTDYQSLISSLPDTTIQSQEEYTEALNTINELKVALKQYSQDEIIALKSKYDPNLSYQPAEKPCEYSFIASEEQLLAKYSPPIFTTTDDIQTLQTHLNNLITQQTEHTNNKPPTIQQPDYTNESITNEILRYYDSVQDLIDFCSNTNRMSNVTPQSIHFTTYKSYLSDIESHNINITNIKNKLISIDNIFQELHTKKSKLTQVNKPSTLQPYKTSADIKKYLKTINQTSLQESIKTSTEILDNFYKSIDEIGDLQQQLKIYQQELHNLNTNDEYKYNPSCEFCCKRPWVARINTLTSLITDIQSLIKVKESATFDNSPNDYMQIFIDLQENQKILEAYDNSTEWLSYLTYKEQDDQLTKSINTLLATKKDLTASLAVSETKINNLQSSISSFISASFSLYDKYNMSIAYAAYTNWKQTADALHNNITDIKEYITYHQDILPRINKLTLIKDNYAKYLSYDLYDKSVKAHSLLTLQHNTSIYATLQEYKQLHSNQPHIIRKLQLVQEIKSINDKITSLSSTITQQTTINAYSSSNMAKQTELKALLTYINDMIDIMDIVTNKFIEYKKDLYDTKVLPVLIHNVNKQMKPLCHESTKAFELDYHVSIYNKKDIHINWLIKTNDDKQQTISIKQASGFQQFAVGLAFRLSVYPNKTCTQLFIDEGFTACDKQNLSIVPSFIKGLLKSYDSIVLVSHIDIIQECTDNVAHITYDKNKKISYITYGNQRSPILIKRKGASD